MLLLALWLWMNALATESFFLRPGGANRTPLIDSSLNLRPTKLQSQIYASSTSTTLYVSSATPSSNFYSQNNKIPSHGRTNQNRYKKKKYSRNHRNKTQSFSPIEVKARLEQARQVEQQLERSIQQVKKILSSLHTKGDTSSSTLSSPITPIPPIKFPSVRECNAALAIFGDAGELKNALKLFGRMRKAAAMVSSYNAVHDYAPESSRIYIYPPSPTLVSYSTLMSRAVALKKEQVALRLWRLMTMQAEFYTNWQERGSSRGSGNSSSIGGRSPPSGILGEPIVPDIRAVNILMNAFAKLEDNESANALMMQLHYGNKREESLGDSHLTTVNDQLSMNRPNVSSEIYELIRVVPKMKPNIVTYNTLIDACHRAGDLDGGK